MGRLGHATDRALAAEITALPSEVRRLRQQLGIPRYDRLAAAVPWLGVYTDGQLARRYRLCKASVTARRNALGIPPADCRRAHANDRLAELVGRLQQELHS